MQPCLRRLYSTLPDAAAAARTASTPRAVRLRRLRKRPEPKPLEADVTPEGSTPTEFARYQRDLAKAELLGPDGRELTEGEWLQKLNERRSRVRGVREVTTKDGEKQAHVVAQKVYLPNIIFRLVRNHTPAGQPYNPYEATFRIPQSVTKTDVRSYLAAVYGVKTTYIRTDNYLAPIPNPLNRRSLNYKTYKRAVVGLVEPFYYPQAMEDMSKEERETRQAQLEQDFLIEKTKQQRAIELLRATTKSSGKLWRWRTGATAQRGNILRRIAEARAAREGLVADTKAKIQEARRQVEVEATA
ncbi:hypothetical protein K474DRAFT_327262 [Panus rudis PR-1116 ss-1]|nr:hypothetical protein K474DRAFT_327262 [Panus rudis PR-1116 ss-1]